MRWCVSVSRHCRDSRPSRTTPSAGAAATITDGMLSLAVLGHAPPHLSFYFSPPRSASLAHPSMLLFSPKSLTVIIPSPGQPHARAAAAACAALIQRQLLLWRPGVVVDWGQAERRRDGMGHPCGGGADGCYFGGWWFCCRFGGDCAWRVTDHG